MLRRLSHFTVDLKMSSLYPSLEDMQVHKMVIAQENALMQQIQQVQAANIPSYTQNPYPQLNSYPSAPPSASESARQGELYPGLGDFMGLELTEQVIALNMPEYLNTNNSSNVSISSVFPGKFLPSIYFICIYFDIVFNKWYDSSIIESIGWTSTCTSNTWCT